MPNQSVSLLIAEDDEDDFLLTREAFLAARVASPITWVKDGEELLDCLLGRRGYPGYNSSSPPTVILLDLNMPKMDGREALRRIKAHPTLRRIPVVILTTSNSEDDLQYAYELGVNSYIRKPLRLEQFVEVVKTLTKYWFEVVSLPSSAIKV